MNDRLSPLILLPPPMTTSWAGTPGQTIRHTLRRLDRTPLMMPLPLFWCDPNWCDLAPAIADALACAVAKRSIPVSALRRDLSKPEIESEFHRSPVGDVDDQQQPAASLPRIVPYRPERYGFQVVDFDDAFVIDLRLTMTRDDTGRFAFSPNQIRRWESKPRSESKETSASSAARSVWVPAATFPPDVESIDQLSSKLNQIRCLAPSAGVFVSIGAHRLDQELPDVVQANPDGIILRMDDVDLEPLQIATITRRARQQMDESSANNMSLWIVPGQISVDDAVKLIALGADAIGIDAWCNSVLESVSDASRSSHVSAAMIDHFVETELADSIERFVGLYLSLQRVPQDEQLGSFDATWATRLNVSPLA